MTSSSIGLIAAACSIVILTTFIGSTQSTRCCLMYTKRPLPCQRLLDYTVQTVGASCDISAIIFHLPGRFVCADPSASWTLRGTECLHERRRRKNAHMIQEETREENKSD